MNRKLVRDGTRMTHAIGRNYHFILCEPEEMPKLLVAKLEEEVGELITAAKKGDCEGVIAEAADVYEVLSKFVDIFGSANMGTIQEAVRAKRAAKGGFDSGTVLVYDKANTPPAPVLHKPLPWDTKPKMFFLNEQHTTHITKAQARRERREAKKGKR